MSNTNSYTKLNDGTWGLRVYGAVKVGDAVTVTTKAGAVKTETVGKVLWSGITKAGVPGALCAIAPRATPSTKRGGAKRGRWTGCSCGSREDSYGMLIPREGNCSSCEHDAE